MSNIKELVKIGILLLLVIFFTVFFTITKGNDPFKMPAAFEFKVVNEKEFSYPISESEYNGEYKNLKGNNIYLMAGKNSDGTYRIYFMHYNKPILKLDSMNIKGNQIDFKDMNGVELKLKFADDSVSVFAEYSLGNAELEGQYIKKKDINSFSSSEFKLFNT